MNAVDLISSRLRFKGRMAAAAIAVSFLVITLALCVSEGFRKEIRNGISSQTGDILVTATLLDFRNDSETVDADEILELLKGCGGIESVTPVIYRTGIVRNGDKIQGVIFKGVPADSSETLTAEIPSRLADLLQTGPGDELMTYFVGESVNVRRLKLKSIRSNMLEPDGNMIVTVPIQDLRRLSGWDANLASAVEVILEEKYREKSAAKRKASEIGTLTSYVASTAADRYPGLFDWLDLIDFNVVAILILMTVVAGFNMISGLLILLFRNVSTIGVLKSLGMTDSSIGSVFVRVSMRLAATGMLIGNGAALLLCLVQNLTHVLKLNPENYFVSFVPVGLNLPLIILSDAAAFVVIAVLLLVPTLFIAKVDPCRTVNAR